MAELNNPHSDAGDDEVARLEALHKRQNEIWQLEQACDDLLDELTASRTEQTRPTDSTDDSDFELPTVGTSRPIPQPSSPTAGIPELEGQRSAGDRLGSQITSTDPGPTPPQPSPGDVDKVNVRVDLSPSAGASPKPDSPPVAKEPEWTIGAEGPEKPTARSASERSEGPEAGEEFDALRTEATPYRTRGDDLKATGMRDNAIPDDGDLAASVVDHDIERNDSSVQHTDYVVEDRPSARDTHREIVKVRQHTVRSKNRGKVNPVVAVLVGIVVLAVPLWFFFLKGGGGTDEAAGSTATTTAPGEQTETTVSEQTETTVGQQTDSTLGEQIQEAVDALDRGEVTVEEINGVVYLMGAVATDADRQTVIGTAESLAAGSSVNSTALSVLHDNDQLRYSVLNALSAEGFERVNASVQDGLVTVTGITPDASNGDLATALLHVDGVNAVIDATEEADRAPALALQLDRLTMIKPIEFGESQTVLTASQKLVLDDAADLILAYPGPMVTIVAYGDYEAVATSWAEQARDHLVSRGVPSSRLAVSATTPGAEQGLAAVQRMEFEPGYALVARGTPDFLVGIVAEGTRSDFALTHSVVDAAMAMAMERTDLGIDISDGMGTVGEAETAIRNYARDRYDLIIVEGSDLVPTVAALAADYPEVAFVMADSSDTYNLPNLSAMRVAADEGGYVLGVLSAQMSSSSVLGAVGTVDAGTDARYFAGFTAGALSINSEATVLTAYTETTTDLSVAEARVGEQIAEGADVVTGSSGVSVTGVGVADSAGALWFGNQADQTLLNPDIVVASQVYHWESAMRRIIAGIDQGSLGGQTYALNLSNGGLVIEYNPGYRLDDALKASVDYVVSGLTTGSINTGV